MTVHQRPQAIDSAKLDKLAEVAIRIGLNLQPGQDLFLTAPVAALPLVRRMTDMARRYEDAARIGAARLDFRQRWAVLSAAGIYGAIGRKVAAAGAHAWDRRIGTSKAEKLGFVARALVQAALPAPRRTALPEPSRRVIAAAYAAQQNQ